MSEIPEVLAGAVRAAAAAAPPHPGDLAAVRRRAVTVRRHRTVTATGLVALGLLAVLGFGVPAERPESRPEPMPAAEPTPTPPAAPAQRLLIDGTGYVVQVSDEPEQPQPPDDATGRELYEWYSGRPGASGVLGTLAEVLPDGDVVELDLRGLPGINNGVRDVVAMPDGRLAALGLVDLLPGVQREDGPCVEGVEFRLLVVDARGDVEVSRNVREMCQDLVLLAADSDTAYLVRTSDLVAHDLDTGEETVLLTALELAFVADRASLAAGRLVTVANPAQTGAGCAAGGPPGRLAVRVFDVPDGESVLYRVPTGSGCADLAGPVRLSPDGRHAAVAYHRFLPEGGGELSVAILDVATGRLVADRVVVSGVVDRLDVSRLMVGNGAGAIAGLAWQDDRTLRYAWYELPEQGLHWLPDLLQVDSLTIR
jgi:hypothetical protein